MLFFLLIDLFYTVDNSSSQPSDGKKKKSSKKNGSVTESDKTTTPQSRKRKSEKDETTDSSTRNGKGPSGHQVEEDGPTKKVKGLSSAVVNLWNLGKKQDQDAVLSVLSKFISNSVQQAQNQ